LKKRRICVVTGTRADFGLLTPLIKEIRADKELQLQIIVTGMHLSPEFGFTYKEIEKEFKIDVKIEILLSSDTGVGISKSMGLAQISFAEAYITLNPDIIVVLGDRFEIFSAVASAMAMNIPIAHLSGGELTLGAIDDAIRHSITKMSHIHFVATEEYRQRVIQLGENPENVFNYGESGLDNIKDLNLLSKIDFEKSINSKLDRKNLLITYHPTTLDSIPKIVEDFNEILEALDELDDTFLIFTKSNADSGGRTINILIDQFVQKNTHKAISFLSLGQQRYLSALNFVDAVLGNTSSGLVEAPSFKIGTINIGSRQKGRVQAPSVLNCSADKLEILNSLKKLYSAEFQDLLKNISNPYAQPGSSKKTKKVLKNIDLTNIIHKQFRDIL
jgi:GDP/UDP-N,N'-diacetylbacillosamine 2-epimerase (hydrolysing)